MEVEENLARTRGVESILRPKTFIVFELAIGGGRGKYDRSPGVQRTTYVTNALDTKSIRAGRHGSGSPRGGGM